MIKNPERKISIFDGGRVWQKTFRRQGVESSYGFTFTAAGENLRLHYALRAY